MVHIQIKVRARAHSQRDQHLGQEEQKPGHLVQRKHAQHVAHQQFERILGAGAKVRPMNGAHNVRILVEEHQELFQTPEEALHAAQNAARHRIIVRFQFRLHPGQHRANQSTDGQNQRTECNCAQVVAQRSAQGARQREERDVWFFERPIPGGEHGGQHHFAEGGHETNEPEKAEHVDDVEPTDGVRLFDGFEKARRFGASLTGVGAGAKEIGEPGSDVGGAGGVTVLLEGFRVAAGAVLWMETFIGTLSDCYKVESV